MSERITVGKYPCEFLGEGVEVKTDNADPQEVYDNAYSLGLKCFWMSGDRCTDENCQLRNLRLQAKRIIEQSTLPTVP